MGKRAGFRDLARMNAQAALRGSPLQVASRAGFLIRRGVAVRPRVSFALVRAISSSSIAGPREKQARSFLRGTGLRAGSLASLRWNPPSLAARRQYSLSPVAVVAPSPPKMGMCRFCAAAYSVPFSDCSCRNCVQCSKGQSLGRYQFYL